MSFSPPRRCRRCTHTGRANRNRATWFLSFSGPSSLLFEKLNRKSIEVNFKHKTENSPRHSSFWCRFTPTQKVILSHTESESSAPKKSKIRPGRRTIGTVCRSVWKSVCAMVIVGGLLSSCSSRPPPPSTQYVHRAVNQQGGRTTIVGASQGVILPAYALPKKYVCPK